MFPYWPAKVLKVVDNNNSLDIRFFGHQHDRHVVPLDKCFCLSEKMPNSLNSKESLKQGYLKESYDFCTIELNEHIRKLENKYDCIFKYAPINTQVDLTKPFQFLNKFKSKTKLNSLF